MGGIKSKIKGFNACESRMINKGWARHSKSKAIKKAQLSAFEPSLEASAKEKFCSQRRQDYANHMEIRPPVGTNRTNTEKFKWAMPNISEPSSNSSRIKRWGSFI